MARARMHDDEIATDADLVRALLRSQFPRWADRTIAYVDSYGTDHDIYRLGEDLSVRLPRIGWAADQARKEGEWLPRLAPHLPLAVPEQVGLGAPEHGYPFVWSVCRWLPGRSAAGGIDDIGDLGRTADDLAGFIRALQSIPTAGAPPRAFGARGGPHVERDKAVRRAIAALGDRIDGPAALRSWQRSLDVGPHEGPEVWVHGDLLPGNLIVDAGRLSGVIDFGGLAAGDPACDLQPAWNVFAGPSRARFRAALDVDDAGWARGRGWALSQALIALPYYWDTNPGIVAQARRALAQVVADA